MQVEVGCVIHVHQFWWAWASLVLEILLLFVLPSKTAKFPFQTMDYSPWGSKNLINRIGSKNFMQVEVDVKCMETNFGGHDISGFGDFAPFSNTFETAKISLLTMDYSPWGQKINQSELTQKIHASRD